MAAHRDVHSMYYWMHLTYGRSPARVPSRSKQPANARIWRRRRTV